MRLAQGSQRDSVTGIQGGVDVLAVTISEFESLLDDQFTVSSAFGIRPPLIIFDCHCLYRL